MYEGATMISLESDDVLGPGQKFAIASDRAFRFVQAGFIKPSRCFNLLLLLARTAVPLSFAFGASTGKKNVE